MTANTSSTDASEVIEKLHKTDQTFSDALIQYARPLPGNA